MPGFTAAGLGSAGRRTPGVVSRNSTLGMQTSRWSATDKAGNVTLAWGGLSFVQGAAGSIGSIRGAKAASGRVYLEAVLISQGKTQTAGNEIFGVANKSFDLSTQPGRDAAGNSLGFNVYNGNYNFQNAGLIFFDNSGANFPPLSGPFGMAVDAGAGLVWFYIEGIWHGAAAGADPVKGLGGITAPPGTLFPVGAANGEPGFLLNTGSLPLAYSVPSGYQPWG